MHLSTVFADKQDIFKSLSEFMAEQCRRTIHGAAALSVLILFRVQAGAGFAAFQVQVAALLGFGGHVACGAKAGPGGYFSRWVTATSSSPQ